ncbi:MAG: energy-coupling factor transporter transmembrane protein EcfT [Oscillospiraceae bacterium]|nr:energy-coupling factor transporter transmembrane protein EcfT [Oscillospiraceae bacterium]
MINIFNYIDRPSPIHRLTGATKLVCLLLWSFASMVTYDTRILALMPVAALILFGVSQIKFRDIKAVFWVTFVFMVLNNVMVYVFAPEHGVSIYGTRTVLLTIAGPYTVTAEQLFYHLNLILKYFASIPVLLLFVCTTDPSEFAASLSRIGVSYRVSYSVALALRYIPDIQRAYHDISQSQQARGVEMSKKESLVKRLKAASAILIPLILSSMDRIEVISNAMELRGFGKGKTRTWYRARAFRAADVVCMALCAALLVLAVTDTLVRGTRYYNPFI